MLSITRIFILIFLFLSIYIQSFAQNGQNIRGKIIDSESNSVLPGATVSVFKDSTLIGGSSSDASGYYKVEKIQPGRYLVKASFIGYREISLPNIVVSSGKEVILNFELEESVTDLEEIVVVAEKGKANNDMATVSTRTFTVEETDRYAGSRGDPARMASNFAGVQGANDSKNDIVIRGNSPLGLLWRLEGVNIPNPNHFGISGSTGGGISILNNKLLATSDFFTGAFPAEYGNAVAGVFDLKMRNGNDEKGEYTAQLGVLGTELLAEGPISKEKRSSYLVNYRYSTLGIFQTLGLQLGTDAVPKYQDAAFKLNFPNSKGGISVFGMGGKSSIDIVSSKDTIATENAYSHKNRDQYFRPGMGVVGINYKRLINSKTYYNITIASSYEYQRSRHDKVFRTILPDSTYQNDSIKLKLGYDLQQMKNSFNAYVKHKASAKHSFKIGFNGEQYNFNFKDSIYNELTYAYDVRLDHTRTTYLVQPFALWKYKISEKLTLNTGLHGQYLTLNNSMAFEPRTGLKWLLKKKQSLSLGLGMHSQMQPTYIYFQQASASNTTLFNKSLDFTRSNHVVFTYDNLIRANTRIKIESYYQQLTSVPVEAIPSGYSVLNAGDDFERIFPGQLVNEGSATNYGLEFTLEKYFSKSYFYMISASLYDAKYKGSDGKEYNSNYNGNFIVNALGTKEFQVGKDDKNTIGLGGKVTWAGGRRYTQIDTIQSALIGDAVYVDSPRNNFQFKDYFRADIKFNYKINSDKVTHDIGIDLVNILGTQNFLKQTFTDGNPPEITFDYQLGFLPIIYYKIDF